MDLEERVDGLYISGRKLDAYRIPDSDILQVDLRLKEGDCPEGRKGEVIRECRGDCQDTYLTMMFSGNNLSVMGELAEQNFIYVEADVAQKYGAHQIDDVPRLFHRSDVKERRMENDRGFDVFVGEELLLCWYDKCGYHYIESGLEESYPLEVACIINNLEKIREYATEGWPPEIKVSHGRMN